MFDCVSFISICSEQREKKRRSGIPEYDFFIFVFIFNGSYVRARCDSTVEIKWK